MSPRQRTSRESSRDARYVRAASNRRLLSSYSPPPPPPPPPPPAAWLRTTSVRRSLLPHPSRAAARSSRAMLRASTAYAAAEAAVPSALRYASTAFPPYAAEEESIRPTASALVFSPSWNLWALLALINGGVAVAVAQSTVALGRSIGAGWFP